MAVVSFENEKHNISNSVGMQLVGNPKRDLDGGLNPMELIESSLALCVSLTFEAILKRDGIYKEGMDFSVEVKATKDPDGANRITNYGIKVNFLGGLDADFIKKAIPSLERGCTISNSLKEAATVTLDIEG